MSTDAGMSESTSLSAELEKAAALLKSKGLDHAAAQLLAPEASVAEAPKHKLKVVKAAPAPKARKVKAKAKAEVKAEKKAKAKTAKAKAKTAKVKVAKTAKVAKAARKPMTGQSGPRITELGWDDLNKKEKLVIGCFNIEGEREVRTIEQLGAEAFQNQTLKKQNSWTRNSLRRLMRSGIWLEKTEPGKYRLTQAARTKLRS